MSSFFLSSLAKEIDLDLEIELEVGLFEVKTIEVERARLAKYYY